MLYFDENGIERRIHSVKLLEDIDNLNILIMFVHERKRKLFIYKLAIPSLMEYNVVKQRLCNVYNAGFIDISEYSKYLIDITINIGLYSADLQSMWCTYSSLSLPFKRNDVVEVHLGFNRNVAKHKVENGVAYIITCGGVVYSVNEDSKDFYIGRI